MARFVCNRCEKCCVSLGPLITIERQLDDKDYYCRCKIDNSLFLAHVDPAFSEEIAYEYSADNCVPPGAGKNPCRFLRRDQGSKETTCTIYTSRPKICRDFRCYRVLIYNGDGQICGRMTGKNTLCTKDPFLEKLWKECITTIPTGDPCAWNENVTRILVEQGYRAETVE